MTIVIIKNVDSATSSLMQIKRSHVVAIKQLVPSAKVIVCDASESGLYLPKASIVICPTVTQLDFGNAKNLRWVHVTSAGVNNLPAALFKKDILITNSSGVHPIPIAEQVFCYILLFARQMHLTYKNQILGNGWHRSYHELSGIFETHGKTLAIVGLGRIGQQVARLAKGFNMYVLAVTKTDHKKEKYVDELFVQKDIGRVIKRADVVVNILPATAQTNDLFNLSLFKKMKKSAYFINVGRGTTVVQKDLIKALQSNIIAGAGLDVFEEEPLPSSSPLWDLENAIITPHHAGWTPYYMDRVIEIFCENLKAYQSNGKMPNLIDKKRGY